MVGEVPQVWIGEGQRPEKMPQGKDDLLEIPVIQSPVSFRCSVRGNDGTETGDRIHDFQAAVGDVPVFLPEHQ